MNWCKFWMLKWCMIMLLSNFALILLALYQVNLKLFNVQLFKQMILEMRPKSQRYYK